MPQYTYGKDKTRTLNFFRTPPDVLEDADLLVAWATKSIQAALSG
jgi:TfoX/Sxy family transcriptional regulator of competence genes